MQAVLGTCTGRLSGSSACLGAGGVALAGVVGDLRVLEVEGVPGAVFIRLAQLLALYNHDRKYDWRSLDLFQLSAKVPSTFVLPINLDVISHKLCNMFFLF